MEQPILDPELTRVIAEADAPRHSDQSPGEWVKSNLFNTWYNAIITVVFGLLGLYLAYKFALFVFVNARWEPVEKNLELFLIGLFPRSERTRIMVQALMMSGAMGLLAGWLRQRASEAAELAGVERESASVRDIISSYWAVAVFVLVAMVIGPGTSYKPWLLLVGCIFAGAIGFASTLKPRRGGVGIALAVVPLLPLAIAGGFLSFVQDLDNMKSYLLGGAAVVLLAFVQYAHRSSTTLAAGLGLGVASFLALSGTGGLSWMYMTLAVLPGALAWLDRRQFPTAVGMAGAIFFALGVVWYLLTAGITPARMVVGVVGLGVAVLALASGESGDTSLGERLGLFALIGFLTWYIGRLIGLGGISWQEWGGFHLNLVVAAAAIALAFPIGLLLALGRRSSLPVVRWLCTAYIELIRGVPLISLLLMAQLFVGFFLSSGSNNLSLTTKAVIVITMFSSAYVAEIVRGGLQAVPKGQTEAGQAMGMSPAKITRLLVLPQALRAVIPSMVGQFISLWKDTSLLTIIGVTEWLGVRDIVHAQEAFRKVGIVETLVFVAFGFWAFSFTMSRESQRLERRLEVGR